MTAYTVLGLMTPEATIRPTHLESQGTHGRIAALTIAISLAILVASPAEVSAQKYIQSKLGGFLHADSPTGASGSAVTLAPFAGNYQQTWLLSGGPSVVGFTSVLGRALDVQWGRPTAGAPVQLWDPNGGRAQRWRLIPTGDGYFFIQSALGMYLDAQSVSSTIGTRVGTWSFTGTDAQQWRFASPRTVSLTNIGPKCPRYQDGLKDFHSFPPAITISVSLGVSPDRRTVIADIGFTARVTHFLNRAEGGGHWTENVFTIPEGREIAGVASEHMTYFEEGSGSPAGGEFLVCNDGQVVTWPHATGELSALSRANLGIDSTGVALVGGGDGWS